MKKLAASTLVEVMVALVIISVVSALFFAIVMQAGNYFRNRQRILIQQEMMAVIEEARQYSYLENETLSKMKELSNMYIARSF